MTITDFLLARIAEDEAAAREVVAERSGVPWVRGEPEPDSAAWADVDAQLPHVAVEGARMLAECQAKRAIIELHKNWPVLIQTPPRMEPVNPTDPTTLTYRATQEIQWATQQQYIDRFGSEPPTAPMLEQLAAVYAAHPDYDETWRPT